MGQPGADAHRRSGTINSEKMPDLTGQWIWGNDERDFTLSISHRVD